MHTSDIKTAPPDSHWHSSCTCVVRTPRFNSACAMQMCGCRIQLQHCCIAHVQDNEAFSLCLPPVSVRKASPILYPMHMINYIFQRHGRGLFSATPKLINWLPSVFMRLGFSATSRCGSMTDSAAHSLALSTPRRTANRSTSKQVPRPPVQLQSHRVVLMTS